MKLLLLSDLHLDHQPFSAVGSDGRRWDDGADAVMLAGDIDEGLKGLRWARQAFPDKPIVYVAGNHEFYRRDWVRHLRDMRVLAKELDIHFLERDSVEIAGVRFLGCTLWTDFEINGLEQAQACMREAQRCMNDYRLIRFLRSSGSAEFFWVRSKHIVPALTLRRHRDSVAWLEDALSQGSPERTVVVTHHAPHPRSVPAAYEGDPLTPAYASDLERLMGRSALWVHGHMHESCDYMVRGTRVVCNPRGYSHGTPPRGENDSFSPGLLIEI